MALFGLALLDLALLGLVLFGLALLGFTFWCVLLPPRGLAWGAFGPPGGGLGASLGGLGASLGRSFGIPKSSRSCGYFLVCPFGLPWGPWGRFWGPLGLSGCPLGPPLGAGGVVLWPAGPLRVVRVWCVVAFAVFSSFVSSVRPSVRRRWLTPWGLSKPVLHEAEVRAWCMRQAVSQDSQRDRRNTPKEGNPGHPKN